MATEQLIQENTISYPANADLSASQYCGVVINSSGKIAVAGAGVRILGVLQNKPNAADQPAAIAIGGVSKGIAAAAFNPGTDLMVNASGQFLTATSTNAVVAVAMSVASAANNVVEILILPAAKNAP